MELFPTSSARSRARDATSVPRARGLWLAAGVGDASVSVPFQLREAWCLSGENSKKHGAPLGPKIGKLWQGIVAIVVICGCCG